jgi:hypothetical protein
MRSFCLRETYTKPPGDCKNKMQKSLIQDAFQVLIPLNPPLFWRNRFCKSLEMRSDILAEWGFSAESTFMGGWVGNQQNSASDCARVTVAGQTRCRKRQKNRAVAATSLKPEMRP